MCGPSIGIMWCVRFTKLLTVVVPQGPPRRPIHEDQREMLVNYTLGSLQTQGVQPHAEANRNSPKSIG